MKYTIMIVSLLLLSTATADVSGKLIQESKNKQTVEKPKPKKNKPPLRDDLDGKPGNETAPFLAQRQLSDGRIVTYQKNEKDAAELVKGLKEDGITDVKLLDPKMWLLWSCKAYGYKKCSGKCGSQQCVWNKFNVDTARIGRSGASIYYGGYCACR